MYSADHVGIPMHMKKYSLCFKQNGTNEKGWVFVGQMANDDQ